MQDKMLFNQNRLIILKNTEWNELNEVLKTLSKDGSLTSVKRLRFKNIIKKVSKHQHAI